jgi:hypothetical protein
MLFIIIKGLSEGRREKRSKALPMLEIKKKKKEKELVMDKEE